MWVPSEGTLRYSCTEGVYRLVLDVDRDLVAFARALLPKHIQLNQQKFPPHVSILQRETSLPILGAWGRHEGKRQPFFYDPSVRNGEMYYWLDVSPKGLVELREELGLPGMVWYTRSPDGRDVFHVTIGNLKEHPRPRGR